MEIVEKQLNLMLQIFLSFFSGVMFFHTDSTGDTYDLFHRQLSHLLKIDNRPYKYKYILCTDREKALKDSQMRAFEDSLHSLCHKHLSDNLICHIKAPFKNSHKEREIIDLVMGDMAGCEGEEEFHRLKSKIPEGAFEKKYIKDFLEDVWNFVCKPRLEAPRVIPKYLKTNPVESLNSRVKNEIDHQPKNLSEGVYLMKKMVQDSFDFMMMALYGQGPLRIAPGSKIRPVPQSIWEKWSPEKQLQHFEQVLFGEEKNRKGAQNPRPHLGMGILAQLSAEEKKQARIDHKEALKVYNLNEQKELRLKSKETGLPQLNISSSVKKKPHQRVSSVANRAAPNYNSYRTQGK